MAGDRRWLRTCREGARRLAEQRFDRERIYGDFARWIEDLAS